VLFRAKLERSPSSYLVPILIREFDDVRAISTDRIEIAPDGRDVFNPDPL